MHADLERLIALQTLDSAIHEAERTLGDEPARLLELEGRVERARQAATTAKESVAQNQVARREIEKELAVHQGRLSKFRDQAAAVKTNQEYHAIQHEMTFAQNEIKSHEDRMLERMVEADDLTRAAKAADVELATVQKAADAEKRAITREHEDLLQKVGELKAERATLVSQLAGQALSVFEMVSRRRNGVAMAEAKGGICTICHVRLRPQVFNTVRRNEAVIQCDHCQRILYFVPPVAAAATGSPS
jgi:uncharacterized protein